MTTKTCRNQRCLEDLKPTDALAYLGFCPSCRSAIVLGFNAGGAVAAVLGAFFAWFAR